MNDAQRVKCLIDKLYNRGVLPQEEMLFLLDHISQEQEEQLKKLALEVRKQHYGNKVYMRGLIEFTNYCKQNCRYCGIRRDNKNIERYRLSKEQILECTQIGYDLGYRTFVLQGGEDSYFVDEKIIAIIKEIKHRYPDCAITLSIGEKSFESYKAYYEAGANRYLLRHETASKELYERLHPHMSFENRIRCLRDLKRIGYEVGAGFIVGIPGQTNIDITNDLLFLKELEPHMVGIGPFIPQKDTPLGNCKSGTSKKTTLLLAIIRLMLQEVLLPATTSLGSVDPKGREEGLLAGANVVMPNLSPVEVRDKYALYDNKICTGDEAAHCRKCIENRISQVGFEVDMSIGSHKSIKF